eukprot:5055058-Pleurochrysis_carterae.AAC.1
MQATAALSNKSARHGTVHQRRLPRFLQRAPALPAAAAAAVLASPLWWYPTINISLKLSKRTWATV